LLEDDLRKQIGELSAAGVRMYRENQQLLQQVAQLRARITVLEQQAARAAQRQPAEVASIAASIVHAMARTDESLVNTAGEAHYTISAMDCELKGDVGITDSKLAFQPVDPMQDTSSGTATLRFSCTKVPTTQREQ